MAANWGGKRKGAGRKPKKGKTVRITFSVPPHLVASVKTAVKNLLLKSQKPKHQ